MCIREIEKGRRERVGGREGGREGKTERSGEKKREDRENEREGDRDHPWSPALKFLLTRTAVVVGVKMGGGGDFNR